MTGWIRSYEVTNGIAEKTHVETVKGQKTIILQTSESKQNDKEIVKNNEKIQKMNHPIQDKMANLSYL